LFSDRAPRQLVNLCGVLTVIALGMWFFFQPVVQQESNPLLEALEASAPLPCTLDQAGYFDARLYGSLQQNLNLKGDALLCNGSYQSLEQRVRLVFTGDSGTGGADITVVLGISRFIPGQAATELDTNVTVMDAAQSRFFGSQGYGRCWTDINSAPLGGSGGQQKNVWRVSGETYCSGALPQISGQGSVTIGDLSFSGRAVAE